MQRVIGLLVVLVLGLSLLPVRAAVEPGDAADDTAKQEKQEKKDAKPRKLRLVKPWADITSLNDEQKQKISEIHADYVEKMNQLRDEEEAAIMALLTEENKSELAKNEAAKKQAAKERAAQRRAEQRNQTTRPSND